jgi:hypothetical protein
MISFIIQSQATGTNWMGDQSGPQSWYGHSDEERNLATAGNQRPAIQPEANHFID